MVGGPAQWSWGFPCLVVFLCLLSERLRQRGGNPRIKTPLPCLDAHNLEVSSRSRVAVSPFLTGSPSKKVSRCLGMGHRWGTHPTQLRKWSTFSRQLGVRSWEFGAKIWECRQLKRSILAVSPLA